MAAYSQLVQHGTMPLAGGSLNQAPTFMEAVMVADAERGKLEKEQAPSHGGGGGGAPRRPPPTGKPKVNLPKPGQSYAPPVRLPGS